MLLFRLCTRRCHSSTNNAPRMSELLNTYLNCRCRNHYFHPFEEIALKAPSTRSTLSSSTLGLRSALLFARCTFRDYEPGRRTARNPVISDVRRLTWILNNLRSTDRRKCTRFELQGQRSKFVLWQLSVCPQVM